MKAVQLSAQLSNRCCGLQQRLRGEPTECQNDAWLYQFELTHQVGLTSVHFVGQRIAISGRPMLEHIADVHLLTLQLDRTKNLGQQLPRLTNKWTPLLVLVCTGRFTHAEKLCVRIAFTRHGVGRTRVQRTRCTRAYGVRDRVE